MFRPEKYIEEKDCAWHPMSEMPPMTTDVVFRMTGGKEVVGEIVVEMSGYYFYRREEPEDWIGEDDIQEWKFK